MVSSKQRIKERDLLAYELTKQIAEFASSYGEAKDIIKMIDTNFEWAKANSKPEVLPYPVDRWGNKIEMPGSEAPDTKR